MDLSAELNALLIKAKETDEYFNPNLIDSVIEGLERIGAAPSDEVYEWSRAMWSR